jgi:hypothetical protein
MKASRVAKTLAIQKIRTWAARLNDDEQQEESHFDRLPLHLQLHIREMAKEAFAREHMQWKVHGQLLLAVSKRKLKASSSYLQEFDALTERINTLTEVLGEDYQLDILASLAIATTRTRFLGDFVALSKQLWESITDLWQVHSQLWGILLSMAKNPTCPDHVGMEMRLQIDAFRKKELEVLERQAMAAGHLMGA